MIAMPPTISVETVRDERGFEGLVGEWDALVATMQRPSPFPCHGWLSSGGAITGEARCLRCTSRVASNGSSARCHC